MLVSCSSCRKFESSFHYMLFTLLIILSFTCAILIVNIQNPIISILLLIAVFFLGSGLLFIFQLEYLALLFLIVYVGAIIVLFLFIIMMLEIRFFSFNQSFSTFFNYQNWVVLTFFLFFLYLFNLEYFDTLINFPLLINHQKELLSFNESNLYLLYSNFLSRTENLKSVGFGLFLEYKLGLLLAAILLLVSMIGSIVLTIGNIKFTIIQVQDSNRQALRNV